jgi:hypothetical protein
VRELFYKRIEGCYLKYSISLTYEEILRCVRIFKGQEVSTEGEKLEDHFSGRGKPVRFELRKNFNLVFRKNRRGGLIGKLVKSKYLTSPFSLKSSRPFKEFDCLSKLRESGVPVTEPIMAIVKKVGFTFYEGGLFTREIADAVPLLNIVETEDISKIRDHAFNSGAWAFRALQLGYLHTDLHLGNVLISLGGIKLIDFDKAGLNSDLVKGVSYLIERWDRGVDKRVTNGELVKALKESFLAGVRYGERS